MSKKQRNLWAIIIGLPGFMGLAYFTTVPIAICVFLMMWGNNLQNE
jgi:hypothetical protein